MRRLAERLAPHPVLLHVDAHTGDQTWRGFQELAGDLAHVELVQRYRSPWASWGLVMATLEGLRTALARECSHTVVMSGQDYPLRTVEHIAAFLGARPRTSWMDYQKMPVDWIGDKDGGLSRATHWNLGVRGRRLHLPARRQPPAGTVLHYGQAQFAMARPLARWVVDEVGRRPELLKYFRWSWAPDELFFNSLAGSSPLAGDISIANLWFTDWSSGGRHPKTFADDDLQALLAAAEGRAPRNQAGPAKLFARKLDLAAHPGLLDAIDRRLLAWPTSSAVPA